MRWSHDWGYGEAKTYEATHNNHGLAKDMIRIAMFNKELINKENIRATIGFQINGRGSSCKIVASLVFSEVNLIYVCSLGFRITFYIMELNFRDIYTINELCYIEIRQSIEQVGQMSTIFLLDT